MKILVTSSRMPFALDEIRKLGRAGHEVYAADTFAAAPGSHSRYAVEGILTPSPSADVRRYVDAIGEIARARGIELLAPAFEEVFYLSRYRDRLPPDLELFAPAFETLARLHHKGRFVELAAELGVPVPRTTLARSREELEHALGQYAAYLARPAYSRGGVDLLANTGPLRGAVSVDDTEPTAENPWLVQEFITGLDVCSFSVVRHGKVTAHSTYVHPKTIEHAGGIVFESIEDPLTLEYTQRFAEATGYHGQLSFDWMRTSEGLFAIESNPRPTAGVIVMPQETFIDALFGDATAPTRIAPAGARRHIGSALLRDMVLHPKEIPSDLAELMSGTGDVYLQSTDPLPGLYQFLSYGHVLKYRSQARPGARRSRSNLLSGYFHDVSWNGQPMEWR